MSILDYTDNLIDESANIGVSSAPIASMAPNKTPINDLMLGDIEPKKIKLKKKPKKLLYIGSSKASLGLETVIGLIEASKKKFEKTNSTVSISTTDDESSIESSKSEHICHICQQGK